MGDKYWNKVVLLCGFEGSDASTTATDESLYAHGNAAVSGDAQIDTAQFRFGSSSALFDGTGDKFEFADSDDWAFGSNPFTLEISVRFNAFTNPQFLLSQWATGGQLSFVLLLNGTNLEWTTSEDGSGFDTDISAAWSPSTATWYEVAVDFDGSKVRAYVDGTMIGSFTGARNLFNSSDGLAISSAIANRCLDGWADEVRITKGIARYASDGGYTPTGAEFPRAGNTVFVGGAASMVGL